MMTLITCNEKKSDHDRIAGTRLGRSDVVEYFSDDDD